MEQPKTHEHFMREVSKQSLNQLIKMNKNNEDIKTSTTLMGVTLAVVVSLTILNFFF